MSTITQATLRLFKALPTDMGIIAAPAYTPQYSKTLPHGYVLAPSVVESGWNPDHVHTLIIDLYGRSGSELNQAFHKSFAKVRDASIQQLVIEQLVHYMTTYGFESEGMYQPDTVYVPSEVLNIPALTTAVRLVIIRGLNNDELRNELKKLLNSGIALAEQTLSDVIAVAKYVSFTLSDVDDVQNYEAKAALYWWLSIVPEQPIDFLRYVVYQATNSALLIKNPGTIQRIKEGTTRGTIDAFIQYQKQYGLERLASIFLRYKPLFLAFRGWPETNKITNTLRRLANTYHVPAPPDYLSSVTSKVAQGHVVQRQVFARGLAHANTFRKVRLAAALRYRLTNPTSTMYRIRNGKSWAKEFPGKANTVELAQLCNLVIDSIVEDVEKNVNGKKVFIPKGLFYGVPATEKQFTGNFPTGTYVEVTEDMVLGVHWRDVEGHRVDLDLSLLGEDGKIGWNGYYRDRENGIYFSGDMTSAPKGASELFHVGRAARGSWLVFLNYYNYSEITVPFQIVVGQEPRETLDNRQYLINPNNLIASAASQTTHDQKMLGVVIADKDTTRFYFAETALGKGISAGYNEHNVHARQYLLSAYTNALTLNEILYAAGVQFVDTPEEADIDLSPEAIDKTTFIKLLTESLTPVKK